MHSAPRASDERTVRGDVLPDQLDRRWRRLAPAEVPSSSTVVVTSLLFGAVVFLPFAVLATARPIHESGGVRAGPTWLTAGVVALGVAALGFVIAVSFRSTSSLMRGSYLSVSGLLVRNRTLHRAEFVPWPLIASFDTVPGDGSPCARRCDGHDLVLVDARSGGDERGVIVALNALLPVAQRSYVPRSELLDEL